MALDCHLSLRPNLKTRANYRSNSIPNSMLVETIIEDLVTAGWKPEE